MIVEPSALTRIGWSARFHALLALQNTSAQAMRVVEVHRDAVIAHDGNASHRVSLLPALHRALLEANDAIAVGDWIVVALHAHDGAHWAHARLEPNNRIVRRDGSGIRHAVVNNVDLAFIVMGLDLDFNLRRLERFLALAHASDAMAVIVLTKADHCEDVTAKLDEVRARIPHAPTCIALDARDGDAVQTALAPCFFAGATAVFLGSSGAGKSTLTNSLLGAHTQDTGGVREHDSRGKHTTTARTLHPIMIHGIAACIIDTPGVRTLQPDVDQATLALAFDDIHTLAMQCRFTDCAHGNEPGCAVRDVISPDRLKNFEKMQREAKRGEKTYFERKREHAAWKALSKAIRARAKFGRESG
jgi:ribosome biogenesis GTPase / thiamine phosphate phosphatase